MNDINFSNSFVFRTLEFDTFNYTDNRAGAPSHYFAYMISGSCRLVSSSETLEIKEGDMFYIPDKCSYRSYWYGENEIKFISLGFKYLPDFENYGYPLQVIPSDADAVGKFLELANSGRLCAHDIGVFYTLVGMLLPKMDKNSPGRAAETVRKAEKYLTLNPYASISELAKQCAVSEAAVYASFKKASSYTPNSLRNAILLEKAKELLITTDKTVDEVSDFFGFSSCSYFRKKFKRYFNMTPKEMRTKYRI